MDGEAFAWQVEAFGKGEFEIELPEAKQMSSKPADPIPGAIPCHRLGFLRPEDVLDHIMRVSVASMIG